MKSSFLLNRKENAHQRQASDQTQFVEKTKRMVQMMHSEEQAKVYDFKTRDIKILKKLLPYLLKIRVRVILATLFLIATKFANVAVPIVLKEIVDTLDQTNILLILPLGLLFAYGTLRLVSSLPCDAFDRTWRV
jgi:hypothetical protein